MAYASLVSLSNILEQNLQLNIIPQNSKYFETLLQQASFLQDFLEKTSRKSSEVIKSLESRIRDVAFKAQDIVEFHVADRLLEKSASKDENFTSLFQDLDEAMEEINSLMQDVMEIDVEEGEANEEPDFQPTISPAADSLRPHSHGTTTMVGHEDDFRQLKISLLSGPVKLEIVSLVGMGGIGKTTLAKKVHNDASIVSHFDICCWVTVTQEYNLQNILEVLLAHDKMDKNLEGDSKDKLHKNLTKQRYLIILDDLWDTQLWDDLRRTFPNDNNGSRILLTTRLAQVAKYENYFPPHYVRFLNNEDSWGLFCEKVFGRDCCPHKLEKVGKEIVKNCGGLPLAINVVGGHLLKNPKTQYYWRSIVENLHETVTSNDEQCSRVLSLSYKHLPHHLRGCFLYLGIFPVDFEIEVSILVNLWVASGFIKQARSKSFEDVAKEYFLDLVERNLIFISKRRYNGKIITCKIHDLIRDLCVKEAKSEKLFHLIDRTLFHDSLNVKDHVGVTSHPDLVRAVYWRKLRERDSSSTMLNNLTNLRYIYYQLQDLGCGSASFSLDKCPFLQTIVSGVDGYTTDVKWNIWEMPQLRHCKIYFYEFDPVYPPTKKTDQDQNSVVVLQNLQTLLTIQNLIFTDEVLRRIPNLKKLGLYYYDKHGAIDWRHFGLYNLECLGKLESLRCSFYKTPVVLGHDITFPPSIKKLTLDYCRIPWKEMTVVGSLPNLQVLKLKFESFVGEEWELNEGEFLNLKTLLLEDLGLVHWRAEADHFPELQHLFIHSCDKLQEIPDSFGEIPTLKLIEVKFVEESVKSSARKIENEQHNFGNEGFQVISLK